jgi:ABC-type transport system involved in cytochrome c biogenesis ATPase subunit
MDKLALELGFTAQRVADDAMMLDGEGVFIVVRGGHKPRYCSCWFEFWAADVERAEQASAAILALVGDARITEPMFTIEWHFVAPRGSLESAHIEELADDVLLDAAYPELQGGVARFIDGYLRSPEAVLVLQGAPGTGKTRLIRAILGEIARRGDGARALYTGDMKALESDALFVKFITGFDDVFVLEDADHLLKPRAEGNENLHRFLTIADGVVRSQGRKIIFSTNLPNVGDLDDALIRPGRCHARVAMRDLLPAEAQRLLLDLCGVPARAADAYETLSRVPKKSYSLAEIYKALG